MSDPCLTFEDLTLGYRSHPAVHHLSGTLARGSLTALVGPNGAGKSTLMKGIVGVLEPMSGRVSRQAGTTLAYLPQQSEIDRSFPARVADLVGLGLWPRRGLLGRFTAGRPQGARRGARRRRPLRFRGPADRHAVGRPAAAGAVCAGAGAGRRADPARRAVQRVDAKTVGDLVALIERWHGEGRTIVTVAARPRAGATAFPRDAADRPAAGRLGRDGRDADGGEPGPRPRLHGGLGRRRAMVRRPRPRPRRGRRPCARPRPCAPGHAAACRRQRRTLRPGRCMRCSSRRSSNSLSCAAHSPAALMLSLARARSASS